MQSANIGKNRWLEIFGGHVAKHGGLLALAVSDGMHPKFPVDDMYYYVDIIRERIGAELGMEGFDSEEQQVAFIEACWELRNQHDHWTWIGTAFAEYLRKVNGMSAEDATGQSEEMLRAASRRFMPVLAEYEDGRNRAAILSMEKDIHRLSNMLSELRAATGVVAAYKKAAVA